MKKSKKLIAIAAAAILATCSIAPSTMMSAFAASGGDNSITINYTDGSEHQIVAYQVFSGTMSGDALIGIQWGDGVNGDDLLLELKSDLTLNTYFASCTDAEDVAKVIETFTHDDSDMKAFADIVSAHLTTTTSGTVSDNTISDLPGGYYLIEETKDSDVTTAKTRYVLKLTDSKSVTVDSKLSYPSLVKKVQEDDRTVAAYGGNGYTTAPGFNDTADYCIGDDVPFELIGTLPSTYDDYKGYYYQFSDTLGTQFTFNNDVTVVVVNGGREETLTAVTDYKVETTTNGFTVTFPNTKNISSINENSVIVVRYTAELNSTAVIGLDGQENSAKLTYTNNPNITADFDQNTTDTPEDKVIVFTYELDINKYKESVAEGNELSGVSFKLQNSEGKWATVDANNILTGWADNETDGTDLTTNAGGVTKVIGLDVGTYKLKETNTPSGYNPISEKTIVISAMINNTQAWSGIASDALTALTISVDNGAAESGNVTEGTVSMDVINQEGSSLPGTGGIGTTIFYVTGGVLVVGAGVLLITKRRASKEDKD